MKLKLGHVRTTQEGIVFAFASVLIVLFAIFLLGLGMGLVVIGRGIDLAMIATMVVAVSWCFSLAQAGMSFPLALLIGAGFAIVAGLVSGILIAFAEIPAIFATLAMGLAIYGIGRAWLFKIDVQNVPQNAGAFSFLGDGGVLHIPMPILAFALLALVLSFILKWTRFGRFVYAIGDNLPAARLTGIPVRALIVSQYVLTGLTAYAAGLVMAASAASMSTRIYNSTMIYDVLLVVVLGGISLSGGRGNVRSILVGTLLVGVMLNGMTILDVSYTEQNLVKSVVLLLALIIDSLINPRDEQTAQQQLGDI
jgi:ribose transport system permease protein